MTTDRLEGLYARHHDRIVRYLHRMARDRALAEDLAQETFLRASRGLEGFRGDSQPSTWLYRIATRVYIDHFRSQAASRRSERGATGAAPLDPADLADPNAPRVDRLFEDSEMGACIREFVDGLPPTHRAALILHDLEGLPNLEVARILDVSLETAKIRVHRARRGLRARLLEHCDFSHTRTGVLHCERKSAPGNEPG